MNVENVEAGRLDEALPADSSGGTLAIRKEALSGKREELDHCVSDADFIAWAKAAKKHRQGPY